MAPSRGRRGRGSTGRPEAIQASEAATHGDSTVGEESKGTRADESLGAGVAPETRGDEGAKRPREKARRSSTPAIEPPAKIRERDLWRLRLIAGTRVRRTLKSGLRPEQFHRVLGLSERKAERMLDSSLERHAKAYRQAVEESSSVIPDPLVEAARILGEALRLSEVEQRVVALAAAFSVDDPLRDAFEMVECSGTGEVYETIGLALGHEAGEVRRALRGTLSECGLVQLSWTASTTRGVPLKLQDELDEILLQEAETAPEMLGRFFRKAPPTKLSRDDMDHLLEDLGYLERVLAPAVERKQRGVNVLIYGPTGTGKTELTRLLASELGLSLYEVVDEDSDGDSIEHALRFRAYALCQRMLGFGEGALVLFDEAEDVFPSGNNFFFLPRHRMTGKAWTNRMLETNPVPTIWISNCVSSVDSAYLRRFSYVLEVPRSPRRTRHRLVFSMLGRHGVSEELMKRLATDERMTPGHLESTSRALELAAPEAGEVADRMASRILDAALRLQGSKKQSPILDDGPAYDLSLLRAGEDLEQLVRGLERSGRGTICLYGPPGTGKTAFVHHVAERLGRPMLLKRASDLLDCYVGNTEKLIARMFEEARAEDAVLLLDEADGMLRDRSGAHRSWEVTQTNEMLTQMESFEGIFFCATNLMDDVDRAALRRFAMKIRIDPPGDEARWRLFVSTLKALGSPEPEPEPEPGAAQRLRRRLERMGGLTPGDAAAVIRRMRLLGKVPGPDELVAALAEELEARQENSARALGFRA